MHTRPWILTALLTALPPLAACGDTSGPGPDPDPAEPITDLPRALTSVESELVSASNQFGFDLLREVVAREDGPNVVLSPLSASIALGMTLNGAGGSTYEAMQQTLGYAGLTQTEINTAYKNLTELLVGLDPDVDFHVANSLWADEGFPFETPFMETVSESFAAPARTLDLQGPGAADQINAWVNEETNGYIPTLLGQVDPELVMLLVNAIYFESSWALEFDPDETVPAPFETEGGSEVEVQLMTMRDPQISWGRGDGFMAAELPYGGGAFSMLVLLPDPTNSARDLAAGLTADRVSEIPQAFREGGLGRFALPRFRLSYGTSLNDPLSAMGMGVAFDPISSDFTRMSADAPLFIDDVRQKTFIEVDEVGTRAAAATSVGVGITSVPPDFIVDRPFVFLLRERLSGTVLFAGVVSNPTVEE